MTSCRWPGTDPQYRNYHDQCWGMAVIDSQELFAKLCLDGQQAGLSWLIILRKQAEYERLFANFEPQHIAQFDQHDIERLLKEPGIVRNRLKVNAIIQNARAYLALEQQGVNFSDYLWQFVDYHPIDHQLTDEQFTPTTNEPAHAMAKALKKVGFKFVGPTICYAFMQAVGMVNDHPLSCPAHQRCQRHAAELFKE
ncbi:DNA-3-methyladenine glycosylase I [Celerinatantimonas yamalensis]|uniref:DNA-3-methyladenine glycosylase I n=1 Tax=Celerinatantimonas yamalensis TaxID=559956 RepID=A0ABW9GAK8_9GAMM